MHSVEHLTVAGALTEADKLGRLTAFSEADVTVAFLNMYEVKTTACTSQILQEWTVGLYPLGQSKNCQLHLNRKLHVFSLSKKLKVEFIQG